MSKYSNYLSLLPAYDYAERLVEKGDLYLYESSYTITIEGYKPEFKDNNDALFEHALGVAKELHEEELMRQNQCAESDEEEIIAKVYYYIEIRYVLYGTIFRFYSDDDNKLHKLEDNGVTYYSRIISSSNKM